MDVDIDTEKTNPFGSGVDNPGDNEDIELHPMTTRSRSRRLGMHASTRPRRHRTYEVTSFITGENERSPLLREENQENREDAVEILRSKFPNWDPLDSSFGVTLNSRGEVVVMLTDSRKATPHVLIDADGNINEKELNISKKIRTSLGQSAEEMVETNGEEIARHQERIDELQEQRATTSDENQRENLSQSIDEELDAIAQLERANENIEDRMTLRDRIKAIFKKIWVHRISCGICCRRGHWRYRG